MKAKTIRGFLLSAALPLAMHTNAQVFQSGSDGSYGPMNIATNTTLDTPSDGVFQCTSINILSGATLNFRRNALNTSVYLLATGDVTISGVIDVSGTSGRQGTAGAGGPGGFDGGQPGANGGSRAGDGHGPGGGKAGTNLTSAAPGGGAYTTKPSTGMGGINHGSVYGNSLLVPLVGGSGGGGYLGNPGYGGGGGGGGILIASNTRIVVSGTGIVRSLGSAGYSLGGGNPGGGSGGAIRLVAPIVAGSGRIEVSGNSWGGDGRIRIDTLERLGWNFSFFGPMTSGARMLVFPSVTNRLDILEAAGQVVSEGFNSNVTVDLPFGASTNQTVTVQARGFTNNVPIAVVVTPDNAPSSNYLAEIVMTNNPSKITMPVIIPVGQASRIHAWTR